MCHQQLAQAVMRRDLALCRERSGDQTNTQVETTAQLDSDGPTAAPESTAELPAAPEPEVERTQTAPSEIKPNLPEKPAPTEDIVMEDAAEEDDAKPVPVLSFDELIADDRPQEPSPPLADSKPSVVAHTLLTIDDPKPPNGGLQLDTKPPAEDSKNADNQPADEDKAPDTANDLDSLFNDPMSAEGTGGENPDFNFDQDGSNDLDFGSFGANFDANGADNDNISSLLPGLEDYANTQPNNNGADVDLNELFGVGDANNGMDSQGAGEQRDSTFEDLMDLANFEGMDGGSSGGNNNNADFDFDSLFN